MPDQTLIRGLVLAAIALFFGLNALRLDVGNLAHTGPGLFPLIVSTLLLVLALVTIVQSRFTRAIPLDYSLRNIGIIMLALIGFVLASTYVSMILGIVLLVFIAALAAKTYSWTRNVKIAIVLVLIAIAFEKLLGLNLGIT